MATVATFIRGVRYDLRDYNYGLEFDDDELVEYINRMALSLDSLLTSMNSSYVRGVSRVLVADPAINFNATSSLNSGNWDSIREIWIDNNRLEKVSLDLLDYKRKFNSNDVVEGDALAVDSIYEITYRTTLDFTTGGASANTVGTVFKCTVAGTLGSGDAAVKWNTGEPQFWALENGYVAFDIATGQDYVFSVHYNKLTATLTTASNMPYNDVFNEIFRELLVMHAKAKKEGVMAPSEQVYQAMFRQIAFQQQIRADRKNKYYYLGF